MDNRNHNYIARARLNRGYTQGQLADYLGVSRPTYINIELGRKIPSISQAKTLAKILSLDLEEIFESANLRFSSPTNFLDQIQKHKQFIIDCLYFYEYEISKSKLVKLIFLIDLDNFSKYGRPITNFTYIKYKNKPTADAFFAVIDDLEEEGLISRGYSYNAVSFNCKSNIASRSMLKKEEIETIRDNCKKWRSRSDLDLDYFMGQLPIWRESKEGDTIIYDKNSEIIERTRKFEDLFLS